MPKLLLLFALGNLVVGSSAFVVSGLVAPIASDLGVSLPAAGQAMTAYALATAVGAPLALVATGRWRRKQALLLALALLLAGNLVCMTAGSLAQLLLGRVLMGVGSMFTPLAAAFALALVPSERRGQALALVFIGMSMSYVIGVPLGAWVGLRFGWPAAIGLMAAASAGMLILIAALVPTHASSASAALRGLGAALRQPGVRPVLGVTMIYFSAIFMVFSFIAPVLTALASLDSLGLSLTLSLFGLCGMAGTVLGGRATDRFGSSPTMKVMLATLVSMMLLLPWTAGRTPAMLLVLALWGFAGFGMMAPQQSRLASASPEQAPLLLSLNASMLYIGMALGAALGGAAAGQVGFARLPWVAAPLAAMALALLWITEQRRPCNPATTPHVNQFKQEDLPR